ncbi:MAG: transposase [Ignavibacteriae bacterium]|nr:transposase [Ignavibacteriota bacterium]
MKTIVAATFMVAEITKQMIPRHQNRRRKACGYKYDNNFMDTKIVREQHHRLDPECYRGMLVVHFTACILHRKSFFVNGAVFTKAEEILIKQLRRFHVDAEVYLFMPDHCHILLRGNEDTSDVLECMNMFKQHTGFWLYKEYSEIHWQKDFYDHILRSEEDVRTVTLYILNNPVRKELVGHWKEYPFKGSSVHNLEEWD